MAITKGVLFDMKLKSKDNDRHWPGGFWVTRTDTACRLSP